MNKEHLRVTKEFSQEFEILTILTNDLKLATLHDLQTKYDTEDVFDMLEIIDAHFALTYRPEDKPKT